MPVITRCPMCRGVMPSSHQEARCPRCGECVLPVARKHCAHCGQDCTFDKRVKSAEDGEYYCQTCWNELSEAAGRTKGCRCSACHRIFRLDEVSQSRDGVVCRGCRARQSRAASADDPDPDTLLLIAAQMSPGEKALFNPGPMPTPTTPRFSNKVISWAVCGAVIVVAFVVFVLAR